MNLKTKKERREQMASQKLASGRVLSLDAPQSLTLQSLTLQSLTLQSLTPQGLNPTRAFSVAEAMIALLIGTIVLGFSAPMITKQLKHNDFTSIQAQIMNKKIENVKDISDANAEKISQIIGTKTPIDYAAHIKSLETDINNLQAQIDAKVSTETLTNKITTEIKKLKEELKSKFVPSGAVMFFDLDACPSGWTALNSKYPKAANAFIRNQSGSGRDIGNWQQNAAPNITGGFSTTDEYGYYINANNKKDFYGAFQKTTTSSENSHQYQVSGGRADGGSKYILDASKSNAAYGRKDSNNVAASEVRPDNIVLLACRKN